MLFIGWRKPGSVPDVLCFQLCEDLLLLFSVLCNIYNYELNIFAGFADNRFQ